MDEPNPLALFSLDDLCDEILNRSDGGIISLLQRSYDGPGTVRAIRRWGGADHECMGIAFEMAHAIANHVDRQEISRDEESTP